MSILEAADVKRETTTETASILAKVINKRVNRPKLVFQLLILILSSIITYFLIVISLDLAEVLLFFKLLILFFDFDSIYASSKSFTLSTT